jgi:hypothetical protein
MRQAIRLGEVRTVMFAGKAKVPAREIERIRKLSE